MVGVGRILAVTNQKGGVGKTTTVVSLGAALAEQGLRVLLVDLDPQTSLTFSVGIDPDEVETGMHEVLVDGAEVAGAVLATRIGGDPGADLVPGTLDLAAAEAALLGRAHREYVLANALEPVRDRYDVLLLDCAPSLGLLTLNALGAADEVVIPLQCEMLSHRGVGQLLDTVADVQRLVNAHLVVRGVLPTMFDARTTHGRAVLADVAERYGLPVLTPPIPRSVRFAEAPATGRSVLQTARSSAGAQAYREVAAGLLKAWKLRPRRSRTRPAGG
jgi:chromosome partitioning protein